MERFVYKSAIIPNGAWWVHDFLQSWPQKLKIRRIEIKNFCAGKPCLISKAVECVLKPVQLKDSDLGLKLIC